MIDEARLKDICSRPPDSYSPGKVLTPCIIADDEEIDAAFDELLAAREELERLRWRRITPESLPNANEEVLVWDGDSVHLALYRPDSETYRFDCDTYGLEEKEVVMWMPIAPPKEEA